MARISYHASHEQFKPSQLLEWVIMAEEAGFQGCLSSDHFHPWSQVQGESGFAWSWLGAAMARTKLSFAVVNAPGQRYHPAIIAQAAATLAEMFPDRFRIAVGSGQALNEQITGEGWPSKQVRNDRLKECVDIIRALWNGETVNHSGLVTVEEATLFTRPAKPPQIIAAAITKETAAWAGTWADGLITISHPLEKLREVIHAFRDAGGVGKPVIVKYHLSYAASVEEALNGAFEQWKTNVFSSSVLTDLRLPEQFQKAAKFVSPEDMKDHVKIFRHTDQYIESINEYIALGLDEIVLHNVNTNQESFIRDFGERILPSLDSG
jgi:coenzyme F420-dependent glucose-6-phosphate dehydrogenase